MLQVRNCVLKFTHFPHTMRICSIVHRSYAMASSNLILYGDEVSPPVRFVMWTANLLGVKLEMHKIDLFKSENKTYFYKTVNFLQKVPALSIGDKIICDSHAIALYLCRLSKDQVLYPADASTKAQIDQMMFFNSSTLFPIDSFIFSKYFAGEWPVNDGKINEWYSAVDYLEHQLNQNIWLAGDKVGLCDLCCGTTVSSLQILIPLLARHNKVIQWLSRLNEGYCCEVNKSGLERLRSFVEKMNE